MKTADGILMPHSVEVIQAARQKKVDEFEALWPGLIKRTKEWMDSERFRCLFGPREVCINYAPLIVINKMAFFTDMCEWVVGTEEDVLLVCIANMLWREYVKR